MADHNRIGHIGEELAAKFLKKKGYQIIATNWHYKQKEVDIIAGTRNEVVFVEVKTRTSMMSGEPAEAVDEQKKRFLTIAAKGYKKSTQDRRTLRFDVIGIVLNSSGEIEDIQHYENAFTGTTRYISSGSHTASWRWKNR